ncbi:MAG: cyclic nucleotide-binding domain-containing protein [Pseudomonadota bacterium]|nr:cyclic nucleotide-binding domain-containing protein [Pseudomonadota bacterium]
MKSSSISYRVADFLRQYPPFDVMSEPDLLVLASTGRVRFYESDETVLRAGGKRSPFIFVVQQGSLRQFLETDGNRVLQDILGEGDLIGLGVLLESSRYLHTIVTGSDVILYTIRSDEFLRVVRQYPAAVRYLSSWFTVKRNFPAALVENSSFAESGFFKTPASHADCPDSGTSPMLPAVPAAVGIASGRPIREGVALMKSRDTYCVCVVDDGIFRGVVSMNDLRDVVVDGNGALDAPLGKVMTAAVPSMPDGLPASSYLLKMLETGASMKARNGRRDNGPARSHPRRPDGRGPARHAAQTRGHHSRHTASIRTRSPAGPDAIET